MITIKKISIALASIFMLSAFMTSCKKENGNSTLNVRMTDAPAAYSAVNVDIREVRVNMRDDSTGWTTLNTRAGIYNLLALQNGIDTLLASGSVSTGGVVKEIRFVLGSNNTIEVNGTTFPLTVPSGSESGLKIKINKNVNASLETLLIDFDAALSISSEIDGYKLRPVLRVK
ncbi:hypothetical protein BH09BAC2_BH09BAC2_09690 [soil metagenome]